MERYYFSIDKKECDSLAEMFLSESAGLNRPGKKQERMRQDVDKVRTLIDDQIDVKEAYVYYSKEEIELNADTVTIQGEKLKCKAFSQINPDAVEGAYLYVCTAGELKLPEEELLLQLYADMWGSAFIDAARSQLRTQLEKKSPISNSFGPGFYGMGTETLEAMNHLLDFKQIGVQLKNNRIMIPVKSCAGVLFAVNEKYHDVGAECETCRGTASNCRLCQIFIDRNGGTL